MDTDVNWLLLFFHPTLLRLHNINYVTIFSESLEKKCGTLYLLTLLPLQPDAFDQPAYPLVRVNPMMHKDAHPNDKTEQRQHREQTDFFKRFFIPQQVDETASESETKT